MKKLLIPAAALLGLGLALVLTVNHCLAQQLPTAPGMGGTNNQRSGLTNQPWYTERTPAQPSLIAPWMNVPTEEPNKDLLVKPAQGPWMILLISYVEQEDQNMAQVARDLILELRNKCGLPAYTYNFGLDERRKEIERVRAEIEKQRVEMEELRKKLGGDAGSTIYSPGVRVKFTRYKVEYGVLLGGYPSHEAAVRERDRLQDLPSIKLLNPARYFQSVLATEITPKNKTGETKCVGYLNPFSKGKAMIVRNPTMDSTKVSDQDKLDVALLRRLNSDECYSLFKNTKPYTLAVKQYQVPTVHATKSTMTTIWQTIGLGGNERIDTASQNAHALAKSLREQSNLDAYVLHTEFTSIVTIGSFNSVDDPRMQPYQEKVNWINANIRKHGEDPGLIGLFPVARPMAVPR